MANYSGRSLLTGVLQGFGSGLEKRREQNTGFADAIRKMIMEAQIKKQMKSDIIPPSQGNISGYTFNEDYGYVPKYDVPSEKDAMDLENMRLVNDIFKGVTGGNAIDKSKLPQGTTLNVKGLNIPLDSGADLPALPEDASPEEKKAWLSQLPPKDAALVKSITNYDYDIYRGLSFKDRERIGGLATMYDPSFSMLQFETRKNYMNEIGKGKIGGNIRSYNTVIGHLGSLLDVLNNPKLPSSPVGWDEMGRRWISKKFAGNSPEALAMAGESSAISAVAGELANVFKNSGGTDQEIDKWFTSYDQNAPREYKKAWIDKGVELVKSRMDAIDYDYERVMGKPYDGSFVSPKAAQGINRIESGGQAQSKKKNPSGGTTKSGLKYTIER